MKSNSLVSQSAETSMLVDATLSTSLVTEAVVHSPPFRNMTVSEANIRWRNEGDPQLLPTELKKLGVRKVRP